MRGPHTPNSFNLQQGEYRVAWIAPAANKAKTRDHETFTHHIGGVGVTGRSNRYPTEQVIFLNKQEIGQNPLAQKLTEHFGELNKNPIKQCCNWTYFNWSIISWTVSNWTMHA